MWLRPRSVGLVSIKPKDKILKKEDKAEQDKKKENKAKKDKKKKDKQ